LGSKRRKQRAGGLRRSPDVSCVPQQTLLWWSNQRDMMIEACGMNVGEYKCTQSFGGEI
jgi:hypothetical protein